MIVYKIKFIIKNVCFILTSVQYSTQKRKKNLSPSLSRERKSGPYIRKKMFFSFSHTNGKEIFANKMWTESQEFFSCLKNFTSTKFKDVIKFWRSKFYINEVEKNSDTFIRIVTTVRIKTRTEIKIKDVKEKKKKILKNKKKIDLEKI